VTTGRELREARKDMRLVKAKEKEFDMQDGAAMGCLMDRELALQATPIVKKVILNPKIYLYYDYAVSTFDFKGDIGDFIQDAVEDFWKSRGYRIVIERKSEVELR
jgi:hypothetical protein